MISAFGVEHGEVSKKERSDAYKRAVYNTDIASPKHGGSGKYTEAERKKAAKIYGRERAKSQLKGWGTGAAIGTGVALGAMKHKKIPLRGNKMNVALAGTTSGLVGQAIGDVRGTKKGMKRYRQELGR